MASLTGQLVAETYKALLKTIDNDILTASEKQITDGFGGGSNVFIDSQGFLRANKYKVTNGLATQFLKADGSLDANTYLTGITSSQIITALGYTPVTNARTLTINGTTYDLSANRSWTIDGTSAVWGNISGTLSNQTDLQNALNAKFNNPAGTISQYIRGDGSLATFPTLPGGLPTGGTAGQILAKIDATDYNTEWIDNYATQTKNEVKLGAALSKGTPVYVSSANGTNMIVSAASNTSEATSSKTFGLLETGGVLNDQVKCVTFGLLAGLDTSMATAGDAVWLGPNGTLLYGLANKPVAPAHMVYIGVVTRVQQNNGEIFVNVQNGFEIEELHDVLIQSKVNNEGLFYESSTGLWKNKSIATVLGYTPQAQLNGTGFVKASGTTISYDNSTYLTTTDAASTYQRLDKMVSNLLASATEYPNSNAVINALALKADALNPVFTGYMTISGAEPKLYFTDTDQNPDYFIGADSGYFYIYDQTAGATKFQITPSGNAINTGTLTSASFIKSGGTSSQYLMADGSVSTLTGVVTGSGTTNYLSKWTSGSALGNSLVFDNGTNVIIGTNVPNIGTSKLEVIGTVAYNGVVRFINSVNQGDVNHGTLMIVNSANYAIGNDASIGFALNNSSNSNLDPRASIGVKTSGNLSGDIVFNTRTEVDYTEKVRIFSGGNFAIGTQTNSGFKLDVNGTGRFSSFLNANAQTTAANGSINVESLDPAIRFRVTGGTANKSIYEWRAVAAGGVNDIMQLRLWNDAQSSANTLFSISPIGAGIFYSSVKVNGTNSALGTLSSKASLYNIAIEGMDSTGVYSIYLRPNTSSINMISSNYYGGSYLPLVLTARESTSDLVLFNDGNISIGSSINSGYKLDVNGTGRFSNVITTYSSGLGLLLKAQNNTGSYIEFAHNSAGSYGYIGSAYHLLVSPYNIADNLAIRAQGDLILTTGGYTPRLTITSTGAATFSSSVTATSGYINGSISALYHGSKFAVGGKLLLPASSDNDIGGILYGYWDTTSYSYEGGLKFQSFKYNGTGYAMADAMTINGQGRVGIGTTNPNRQFVVSNGGASGIELSAGSSTATIISYNRSLGAWQPLILQEGTGNVLIGTSTDSGYRLNVNGVTNSSSGFTGGGGYFTSQGQANNTPSVPSASIGVYANTYAFIELSTSDVNGGWIDFSKANGSDFGGRIRYYNNPDRFGFHTGGSGETITFSSGGNITATAFFESSDMRLKTLIDGSAQVAGIENLEAKLYEKEGKMEFGYFAQDAEKLMPYAVEKNADGFLTLSYREVHTAKIARLEKRVAELEKQLNLN